MKFTDQTLLGRFDGLSTRPTRVRALDARAKVIVILAFVVTVASFGPHDLSRPLPLLLFLTVMFSLGEVRFRPVAMRVLLASPFAIMIGLANPFLDQTPLLALGPIALTGGWVSFISIVLRFALSLTAVLLLVATTGFDEVCLALGRLGVPRVFVTQLLLLHRYGFVLGEEASRMIRAHALRSPDRERPTLTTASRLLGQLLLRALDRAERIHAAMICRGFTGMLPVRHRSNLGWGDFAFALSSFAFFTLVRAVDLTALAGALLIRVF